MRSTPVLLVSLGILLFAALLIPAESTANAIKLGMSTALSGPAAELGQNMRAGVLAALHEANNSGGIQGRVLELLALDDGYEPARTVPNMHALINNEDVLAIVGNVGTPTAVAAVPIANERQVLMFGNYTGAGVLRKKPPDKFIINYRASYAQETSAMVDGLIDEAGIAPEEIAFFTQRDAYGDAGFVGGLAALTRHGLDDENKVAHGRYERNTFAVENGLADILLATPPAKAIIMVGSYQPCAAFIKLAREVGLDAIFLNVSFVGALPLAKALGDAGDGVIVTQVVPHVDADLPIVKAYRSALASTEPESQPSFGSLEGYIVGRLLIRALETIPGNPNRPSVVEALEGLGEFDIGLGVEMSLGPDDHQASDTVWPTIIRSEHVIPFAWSQLGKSTPEAK